MYFLSSIVNNSYLSIPICVVGGYLLNSISIKVNVFVARTLGLPIDMMDGKNYEDYTADFLESNEILAQYKEIDLDKQLGKQLWTFTTKAISEEILLRYVVEGIVKSVLPQGSELAVTAVSTILFSAIHLNNPLSVQPKRAQLINTAGLGAVCSLVKREFGLLGAMAVHVSYNVYGWQFMFNKNFKETAKVIKTISVTENFNGFINDIKVSYNESKKKTLEAMELKKNK